MSETSNVVTPAIKAINQLPETYAIRANVMTRNYRKSLPNGTPDIIGVRKGRFFGIECKSSEREKLNAAQKEMKIRLCLAGAVVFRADTQEQAYNKLLELIP